MIPTREAGEGMNGNESGSSGATSTRYVASCAAWPRVPKLDLAEFGGALMNLGLDLGRSTIARILEENGIEPARRRGKTMPWKSGWHRSRAIEPVQSRGRSEDLGIWLWIATRSTRRPSKVSWLRRAWSFCGSPESDLNAYAERFVRSIKQECLRRVVPLGEGHLRRNGRGVPRRLNCSIEYFAKTCGHASGPPQPVPASGTSRPR
jgi:hypothetical protein